MTTAADLEDLAHDHVFLGAAHDDHARRTLWVVGLTALMMVAEIIAGYWTGSMALLADGFHMATHAGALGVAAAAYAYARKHARSERFSFGTGKVGDLAGFASALVLGMVALGIGVESVKRLLEPTTVAFGEATIVAVVGLAVNLVSALLLGHGHHHHGHGHDHHAHDHHGHDHHHDHSHHDHSHHGVHQSGDNNLRSAYMHVLADALTSVLAIVALLAGRLLGWVWLDPVMGIVGALVIGRWSWTLMRDTAGVLLDATDAHVAAEVRELLEGPGDVRICDLHVWRVGPQAHAAIVSVVGGLDAAEVRRRLAPVHELAHLTVEAR
ncbi:MAG: cation transporter [Phenylobacterium sp.]|uniref:CDF family Co(II)/Ni(II) efflux transporter DmeF n=1 Tax=Phenylobacterium sp. TaxID=1871053 RepID=UPI0025E4E731|nr:CDF family Co(II)/Ni(II) efflux transporter DmeF [Phenylobacterium sp.]MBA4010462.1 cation transporter [Phenylobacterium sp.]